jgi:pyruvate/2-oxoglutarate/acetoin dehydrogenase E1 component
MSTPAAPAGLRIIRPGRDLTLLVHGPVRRRCEAAVRALGRLGIEAELIELGDRPGPAAAADALLIESLQRTGRLACITEAGPAAVAAGALLARVGGQVCGALQRPCLRIVLPAEPLPPQHLVRPLLQLVAGPRAADAADVEKSRS